MSDPLQLLSTRQLGSSPRFENAVSFRPEVVLPKMAAWTVSAIRDVVEPNLLAHVVGRRLLEASEASKASEACFCGNRSRGHDPKKLMDNGIMGDSHLFLTRRCRNDSGTRTSGQR